MLLMQRYPKIQQYPISAKKYTQTIKLAISEERFEAGDDGG